MFEGPIQLVDVLAVVTVFVLCLSIWIGLVVLWSARREAKRKQMDQRLGILAGAERDVRVLHLWHKGGEATTVVPGSATRETRIQKLQRALREAGVNVRVDVIVAVLGLVAIVCGSVAYVMVGNWLLAIVCAIAPIAIFRVIIKMRLDRRASLFERQFVDAMQLASRSLRSGHPLMGAFQLVAEELPSPVSDLFHQVCQHHEMGASLERALAQAAATVPTPDVKLFSASVAIQTRSGGSLADMMERLSAVIRDRMRIARKTRVLSAQTQLSKRILIALPIAMFVLLSFIAGEYMDAFFTTPAGNMLLIIAAAGLVLGGWLMNRMAVVRY